MIVSSPRRDRADAHLRLVDLVLLFLVIVGVVPGYLVLLRGLLFRWGGGVGGGGGGGRVGGVGGGREGVCGLEAGRSGRFDDRFVDDACVVIKTTRQGKVKR